MDELHLSFFILVWESSEVLIFSMGITSIFLSPLIYNAVSVIDYATRYAWVYFWALSIGLIPGHGNWSVSVSFIN